MSGSGNYRSARLVVYGLLSAAVLGQAIAVAVRWHRTPLFRPHGAYATVQVSGNVAHPGRYRIPEGTSRFELLKVAGVRPTSDLAPFALSDQVGKGEHLTVGTMASPAALSVGALAARLEFFLGGVMIRSHAGALQPKQAGMGVVAGDAVVTDSTSQAEISVGPFTRVDVDDSSELAFDKVAAREGDRTLTSVTQKQGTSWYRIVYSSKDERFRVATRTIAITPVGTGADFMVEITPRDVRVHALEGLLLVERTEGNETLNLVAGQTVTVLGDRPFQVTQTASDVSATRRFAELQKHQSEQTSTEAPVCFVYCTLPHSYYLVLARFDTKTVTVVTIPAEVSVERYAVGFSTLDEAYLLGGSEYVQNLVEQLLGTRVERYCALDRDGLLQIVAALGGVSVNVDDVAARFLHINSGMQYLNADQLFTFLKPIVSGLGDSRKREQAVLAGLFDALKTKRLVVSARVAERAVAVMKTNFTMPEILGAYGKFASRDGWRFSVLPFPCEPMQVGGKVSYEPKVDEARRMLFTQG